MTSLVMAWAIVGLLPAEPAVTPLPRAHAHNDYEHTRPLLDALDQGFCSVEADIWLTKEGLQVGHTPFALKPGRTLQSLYLDPLKERIKAQGGRVYRDGPKTFTLLIDVKTDAKATYAALEKVLEGYAEMLTVIRDNKPEERAVTIILSGNRDVDTIPKQAVRYVGIDGRPVDLNGDFPTSLVPWISASWSSLFKWDGKGMMPAAEREKMEALVAKAHQQKRKVRFWGTPDLPEVWKLQRAVGVDLINTDKLADLRKVLTEAP